LTPSEELRKLGIRARKPDRQVGELLALAKKLAKRRDKSKAARCIHLAVEVTEGRIGKWIDRFMIYDNLIGFLAELGQFEEALKIAEQVKPPSLKSYAFAMVSKGYLKRGELEKALLIADKVSRPSPKGNLLIDIAEWCIADGNAAKAKELLSAAFAAAQTPGLHKDDKSEMCASIALWYSDLGVPRKALQAAGMIQHKKKKELVLKQIGQGL
jgi:tetratricopeptide (TPR) repeat protein